MLRLPSKMLALLLLAFSFTSAKAACTPQQEENLMTTVLYREAVGNRHSQAKVAATVFVRMATWGYSTLCEAMTDANQYVHTLKGRAESARLALARESAQIFLREHAMGVHTTEGAVFAQFKQANIDSFHAARAQTRGGEDNVFYSAHRKKR